MAEESKAEIRAEYDLNAKWDACIDLGVRRCVYSSLAGAFTGLLLFHVASCGTPVWMGKGLTCVCFKRKASCSRVCINLSPIQDLLVINESHLLRHRTKVYFDASRPEHQDAGTDVCCLIGQLSSETNVVSPDEQKTSKKTNGRGFTKVVEGLICRVNKLDGDLSRKWRAAEHRNHRSLTESGRELRQNRLPLLLLSSALKMAVLLPKGPAYKSTIHVGLWYCLCSDGFENSWGL